MFDGLCAPIISTPLSIPSLTSSSTSDNNSERSMDISEYLSETPTSSPTPAPTFNPFGPAVGEQLHVYPCHYKNSNQTGHLHIATKAVCFRCTAMFGWEVGRVVVPLRAIVAIEQGISNSGNGADVNETIVVKTRKNVVHEINILREDVDIDFAVVLDSLTSAWKECEASNDSEVKGTSTKSSRQLFRRACLLSGPPDTDSDDDSCTEATDDDDDEHGDDDTNEHLSVARVGRNLSISSDQDVELELWSNLLNSNDEKFTENVAVNVKLNITLDDFLTHFICNDATTSLAAHHEAIGDFDVKATRWEDIDDNHQTQKRSITYKHPISAPLAIAPPAGAATKTQTLERFGDHGICLDTETWINDVPLADCFYVADRLLVSAETDGQVSLTVKFGVCFIKRTMFRGIINSTSVHDVTAFHKGYIDSIRHKIANIDSSDDGVQSRAIVLPIEMQSDVEDTIKSIEERPQENETFDVKTLFIVILLLFVCWEHIYFAKRFDNMSEQLARMEQVVLLHSQIAK